MTVIASRQQFLQAFRDRLNPNNLKGAEHVVSMAQMDGELEDALGLYSSRRPRVGVPGQITVTVGDRNIPLLADFLYESEANDWILRALENNQDPTIPPQSYSAINYGNQSLRRRGAGYYDTGLSQPITAPVPATGRPTVNQQRVNGIDIPVLTTRYNIPSSTRTWTIYYSALHKVEDDQLELTFNVNPANGDGFIIDGATITFIPSGTPTPIQCLIAGTKSGTVTNLKKVLTDLGLTVSKNGSKLSIAIEDGGAFDYEVDEDKITSIYTPGINTVPPQHNWAVFDFMHAKALQGRISQGLVEKNSITELENYSNNLIQTTLTRLTLA